MREHLAPLLVPHLGSRGRRGRKRQVRYEHVDLPRRADELLSRGGLHERPFPADDRGTMLAEARDQRWTHEISRLRDQHPPAHETVAEPGHTAILDAVQVLEKRPPPARRTTRRREPVDDARLDEVVERGFSKREGEDAGVDAREFEPVVGEHR